MTDEVIEDLQIRIEHQELAIEQLNETVASQALQLDKLRDEVERLRERLLALHPSPLGQDDRDEPPPHY
jgi:SlyX protein